MMMRVPPGSSTSSSSSNMKVVPVIQQPMVPVSVSFEKEPDVYGQVHPIETEELIESKLKEMDEELFSMILRHNHDEQIMGALIEAQEKCPELLTSDFKLAFLRCEVFHTKRAAKRLATYWRKRLKLFGPEKAFLPLTLEEALKDDKLALEMGYYNVYQSTIDGRSILFVDSSLLDHEKYHHDTDSLVRALWYLLHAALFENPTSQKRGIIVVDCEIESQIIKQWDTRVAKANIDALLGGIPLRVSGIHFCHPPWYFGMLFGLIRIFIPQRIRHRIHLHAGSGQQILDKLQHKFGLPPQDLPEKLGGQVSINILKWLEQRRQHY